MNLAIKSGVPLTALPSSSFKGRVVFFLCFLLLLQTRSGFGQSFIHPGIDQSSADLRYMKNQVLAGEQPWKDAFIRLEKATDLNFVVKPRAHVMRGPYGKPNIGGVDLLQGANMAYNCALMWYITGKKVYTAKAIEILNKWSLTLQDFDYNDAKLLAAWTGHVFCNAAEILKYSDSGWQENDRKAFSRMLLTVYYPLLRFYYPRANGNWDGAIIHSVMAIAIYTDNRDMFDNALNHFLYGPANSGILKYIYPSGQCQESTRDQGHVQLGLGEFAGAAKVAFTQGIDLFSMANNRIALGFEYTAGFLLGNTPFCYGRISERSKKIEDDYEYVYRHYVARGLSLPYTKAAADSVRSRASRSVLTAFRAPSAESSPGPATVNVSTAGYPVGALEKNRTVIPPAAIRVKPGASLQQALDSAKISSRCVLVERGLHVLPATLKIPSGVNLMGEGIETVLLLDPASGMRDAVTNGDDNLHDITIRDLVIEGSVKSDPGTDPNANRSWNNLGNRGGIIFRSSEDSRMRKIVFSNVTVRNCTFNGVLLSGAEDIQIKDCDFSENGSSVVPGPQLQHNLLIMHSKGAVVSNCRLDNSPYGSGISLLYTSDVEVNNCEIARNAYYGICVVESQRVGLLKNLLEANDRSGIMLEYQYNGSSDIAISENLIQYNNGFGIESYSASNAKSEGNVFEKNAMGKEEWSTRRHILMK